MNDGITFVTSVSLPYWKKYGARMVDSFLDATVPSNRMLVYHEASKENVSVDAYFLPHERLAPIDLYLLTGYPLFEGEAKKKTAKMAGKITSDPDERLKKRTGEYPYDYRFDAYTFGKKAFSIIHAARSCLDRYLFWVDADVVFRKPILPELLRELFRNDADVVYFGRMNQHTESGFFGLDLGSKRTHAFIKEYARFWEEKEIFKLRSGWTDCHAFDEAMTIAKRRDKLRANNLSTIQTGHVIAASPLGEYLDHQKGPRKKLGVSPEAQ